MQKLLLLPRSLSLHDLCVFSGCDVMIVVEPVSFLGDPCFVCIEYWRGRLLLVQGGLPRYVGRLRPMTQLVDLVLLA